MCGNSTDLASNSTRRNSSSYITSSKAGLSEPELEDILSLDETVLQEIFQFTDPTVRRLPPILWRKIRRDLRENFQEREADGSRVIVWAHKQVTSFDAKKKSCIRHGSPVALQPLQVQQIHFADFVLLFISNILYFTLEAIQ